MPSKRRIIYDLGSNNGDDIPYYLLKAERVIAVEANPILCDLITTRFQSEVACGRLVIENCAITKDRSGNIDFYIHNTYDVLSTLAPGADDEESYTKTSVKAESIASLIRRHGPPYYIKIDIEGHDERILDALANENIMPPYISAESHTIGVFSLLSERLGYKSFKLVDGESVNTVYNKALIHSPILKKRVKYSFPHHSAGPFGNDIHGEWLSKGALLKVLAMHGLGWRDIHASTNDSPSLNF